ncbi:MAG: hypothetical protein LUI85_21700 [Bacteroides sp.]|nr:hypothetical protein [Bacteroides sp.]
MASSTDFEKLWFNYQELVKTKQISIVDYCTHNGIVYFQFEGWYKNHIAAVRLIPVSKANPTTESLATDLVSEEVNAPGEQAKETQAAVDFVSISFANGLEVCQKSLDYLQ